MTYGAFDAAVVCLLEPGTSFLAGVTAATAADDVKDRDTPGWATARRAVAVWRLRSMTGELEWRVV
ncbi:hypothetical protein IMZ48_29535 [Candidatus Bathyarchaeota archaeon]|nr:hypothetical protein [Candidatus Bathyarchaeota archaeon]